MFNRRDITLCHQLRRHCIAPLILAAVALGCLPAGASAGAIAFDRGGDIWSMRDDGSGQSMLVPGGANPHMNVAGDTLVFRRADGIWKLQNRQLTKLTSSLADQPTLRESASTPEIGAGGTFLYTFSQSNPLLGSEVPLLSEIRRQLLNGAGLGTSQSVCQLAGDHGYPQMPSPNPAMPDEFLYTGCRNSTTYNKLELRMVDSGQEALLDDAYTGTLADPSYSPDGSDVVYVRRTATTQGDSSVWVREWTGTGFAVPRPVLTAPNAIIEDPRIADVDGDGFGERIVFAVSWAASSTTAKGIYSVPSSTTFGTLANASLVAADGNHPAWSAKAPDPPLPAVQPPATPPPATPPPVTAPPPPPPLPQRPVLPSAPVRRRVTVQASLAAAVKATAKALREMGTAKLLQRRGVAVAGFEAVTRGTATGTITSAGKPRRTLASGSRVVKASGPQSFRLRLTARGRAALRRAVARKQAIGVRLTLRFKARGGKRFTSTATVRLKSTTAKPAPKPQQPATPAPATPAPPAPTTPTPAATGIDGRYTGSDGRDLSFTVRNGGTEIVDFKTNVSALCIDVFNPANNRLQLLFVSIPTMTVTGGTFNGKYEIGDSTFEASGTVANAAASGEVSADVGSCGGTRHWTARRSGG